jgi:hypothetical protein
MKKARNRKNEKGAAMVTVLMISLLLLVASTGLIVEVTMNTSNVTDSTAEQQAYNAAESGIQSAINVLRGNVLLTNANRLDPNKPVTDPANRINFRKAVTLSSSNLAGDTTGEGRLSRWMNYDYVPAGSTVGTRVTLGNTNGTQPYTPQNGYAFSVTVDDPDNTGEILSFSATGQIYDKNDATNSWKQSVTVGTSPNTATVSYTPFSATNLDVTSGSANTNIGRFLITNTGSVTLAEDVAFRIKIQMTAPYTATRTIRGFFKAGTYAAGANVPVRFSSSVYQLMGSNITVSGLDVSNQLTIARGTTTNINVNMTQAEPYRVVVRSTGYGPRGAMKVLEATVQKNFFNGLTAPATLTLIGPPGSEYLFDAGNSQNVTYSGDDVASNIIIPPVGTTNDANLAVVQSQLCATCKPNTIGSPANVNDELPEWLQSTQNLDSLIQNLKQVAISSGRYYTNGQTPSNGYGDIATGTGITFIDGDLSIAQEGGGLMIVTGSLNLKGGFDFNGLIIVTGEDGLLRNGGGNGKLRGNIVIAPYDRTNLNAGFKSPKYAITGGGISEMRFDSNSLANGMTAVSNFVLGVAEK